MTYLLCEVLPVAQALEIVRPRQVLGSQIGVLRGPGL